MSDLAETTAIALPGRLPALLRIYNDVKEHAARMLFDTLRLQRRRGERAVSIGECRQMIDDHLIWDPENPGVPLVGRVAFEPKAEHVTFTLGQKLNRDRKPMYDEATGEAIPWLNAVEGNTVSCSMTLPGSKVNPCDPSEVEVVPLFKCNGLGGIIGYAYIDEQGALRGSAPMLSIFLVDFDPKTGREKNRVFMLPLGLARHENLDTWGSIIRLSREQSSARKWTEITPIPHALGYKGQYLDMKPVGMPGNNGLLPSWRNTRDPDYKKPDGWIAGVLLGKIAKLDGKSQPIIIRDEQVPVQRFKYIECWGVVCLRVWGLPEEMGSMEGVGETLSLGKANLNVLALLGVTIYDISPRSAPKLVGTAIRRPPIDRMIAWGLMTAGESVEVAKDTLRGMRELLLNSLREAATGAVKDLVHNLSPAGTDALSLSFADVLGGEPTGELLEQVLNNPTEDNLLVIGILASQTASNLGLEVWDPKCWVWREAFGSLLMNMAQVEGISLPLPPEADASPPKTEAPPAEDSTTPDAPAVEGEQPTTP